MSQKLRIKLKPRESTSRDLIDLRTRKTQNSGSSDSNGPSGPSGPSGPNGPNTSLIEVLEQLVEQTKRIVKNSTGQEKKNQGFRLKQLSKAVSALRNYDQPITSGQQVSHLKGVGRGTVNRINEILESGTLEELSRQIVPDSHTELINQLTSVHGIGEVTAQKLIAQGVHSVEHLQELVTQGHLPVTHSIRLGLEYYHQIRQRIPRSEIAQFEQIIRSEVDQIDPELRIVICGSYRRGLSQSGDIDLLMSHPQIRDEDGLLSQKKREQYLPRLVNQLHQSGLLIADLTSLGQSKYMGIGRLSDHHIARRIDIRFVVWESFYPALLYFTGSKEFNIQMRQIALSQGYSLDEYGIFRIVNGQPVEKLTFDSEEEIFAFLGMVYNRPEERDL